MGAVSSPGFVNEVQDLYHYREIRALKEATMFVARVERPTLVLGGSQSLDVINAASLGHTELRRRRGGGGVVLLERTDLWVDWWIPADDARWVHDVHTSSMLAGNWWAAALREVVKGEVSVHTGSLSGEPTFRVVCFAGLGPGEVVVDGRKAVGVTQWRVREGVFLSTVIASEARDVTKYLAVVPEGLIDELDHHTLSALHLTNHSALVDRLAQLSGPWLRRNVVLTD